jgi:putative addiction module antidote
MIIAKKDLKKLNVATFVVTSSQKIIKHNLLEKIAMLLNVKKRGNSLSVIIPKEMAVSMNIEDGDNIFATKTPSGYEISAYDPDFAKKMKKYHNALIELAK